MRPAAKSSSCSPTTPTPTKAWPRSRALPPSAASWKLPQGWRFRVKTLDRDLVVSQDKTGKPAHVMQDDLLNRYQGSDGGKAFNHSLTGTAV